MASAGAITALLAVACLVYVSSFWGQGARLLPAPMDVWHDVFYRQIAPWWHGAIGGLLDGAEATALYRTIEAFTLGLVPPIIGLWIARRSPADAGLRAPVAKTAPLCIALSLPVIFLGIALSVGTPDPWGTPLFEAMELAAMVPEHFLLFGVVLALMMPERRLSAVPMGDFKLSSNGLIAVFAAGALFQVAHIGVPALEAMLALPVGLLFAYMTLRTASIWPALLAHWALNLIPYSWSWIGAATP